MKTKLKDVLLSLKRDGKSVMAFNLQNFYQLEAANAATERLETPVIMQFSERYLRFLDAKFGIQYIMNTFSNDYTYFHLDHCIDLDFIKFCVDAGFDSVMYDGSASGINTNITNSVDVKGYALEKDCLLEGELGKVLGVEDGFGDEGSSYAEISEIMKYVTSTNVDLMALGIGNAHGFYNSLDELNINILKEASEQLSEDQLFVLHGGTGLPDDIIKEAISYGVVKINVSTQIKKRTMELMEKFVANNKLYNEIAFTSLMVDGLSNLLETYMNKYTK